MSHMVFARNGAYIGDADGAPVMLGVEAADDGQVVIHAYTEKLDAPEYSFYLDPADAGLIRDLLTSAKREAE